MINRVGREIPDEILERYGKEGYQGPGYRDGAGYKKAAPAVRSNMQGGKKLLPSLEDALRKCGIKDGMVLSFHHHFRDGDYVVNMVMETVAAMGIKDLTICASSLGAAHDPVAKLIEDGVVTGIQSSGVRGKIGEAISGGKLKNPAIIRSHGGRVRAIEEGDVHIDIAFIGASTSDEYGNARGVGGKSNCGVLSYSMADAKYADRVVVVTDCLVGFPNLPASISQVDVDYVVQVEEIGNPDKIVSNVVRMTSDVRELKMAEYCAKVIAEAPFFKDGFSFQTGGGGAALAVNRMLKPYLEEKSIKMGFAIGGITEPMCELLKEGFVRTIVDAQCFDAASVESVEKDPGHFEISTSEYANPMNKGAYVNRLDYVVLGALEIDTDFNVNVVTGSDGIVRGAPGGHPDTAAGSNCSIIVAPLLRSRIPTVCDRVVTVTTPGEVIDVLVTDYGIAVNPRRQDLLSAFKEAGLPLKTIVELRDIAYSIVGKPEELEFEERVVGIVESRDGTILDVIRQTKKEG
ncbi:citrate lyase subunit alpha [Clostridium transplantifaecale]|uniref:citrate lyase subunit alpha n=1 Tax=Clostridium transplantifaecale TaxID=2479838 RepID=UPI000F62CAD3|nr:citrate lyase subunit alpha [Clostridium transplantifaecale]